MPLSRHALSAVVLFVGGALLAPTGADAGTKRPKRAVVWERVLKAETEDVILEGLIRRRFAVAVASDTEVASVDVRVSSDGGDEDLALTESDAWLHGGAALAALPGKDAALALTLYDAGSASLMRFSGTLAADGTVTLDEEEPAGPCEIISKLGCSTLESYDVEILAAEVYPSGKGYALTFDLAGADTYEVAYATVEVAGGEKAEVDWDAVGSVWEAEATREHTGEVRVKATVRDTSGRTVENVMAELAEPWDDDGEGVTALSAGAGTSVALHRWDAAADGKQPGFWSTSTQILTFRSEGWSAASYPTHAEVELAGGGTTTVPANSYQRRTPTSYPVCGGYVNSGEKDYRTTFRDTSFTITSGSFVLEDRSVLDMLRPQCSSGTCVVLVEGEKGYELAVTTYGTDPGLPSKQDLGVVLHDAKGTKVSSETVSVTFDGAVTAVFASELTIEGDPIGSDASGSVRLLGAADKKGKRATLSKDTFYGSLSRDTDGDLALGGYGADDHATSDTPASLLLGDPLPCAGVGCDGDWGPPVIQYAIGGKVTKIVVSSGGLAY